MKMVMGAVAFIVAGFAATVFMAYWSVVFVANLIGLVVSLIKYISIIWSERNEPHP